MALLSNRKFLLFAIPIALVIVGCNALLLKESVESKPHLSISRHLASPAEDLIAAGIGNSFVDEPWFTKADLHALSYYQVVEGKLNVILRNASSGRFFTLTTPKFMRDAGFKTRSEESEVCRLVSSLNISNTFVLASDKNLYSFDPFYGCTSNHGDYLKQLDAATDQVQYNTLLIHP